MPPFNPLTMLFVVLAVIASSSSFVGAFPIFVQRLNNTNFTLSTSLSGGSISESQSSSLSASTSTSESRTNSVSRSTSQHSESHSTSQTNSDSQTASRTISISDADESSTQTFAETLSASVLVTRSLSEKTPTPSFDALRLKVCNAPLVVRLSASGASNVVVVDDKNIELAASTLRTSPLSCFSIQSLSCHTWCIPSSALQQAAVFLGGGASELAAWAQLCGPRNGFVRGLCAFRVSDLARTLTVCFGQMPETYHPETDEQLHLNLNASWFCNASTSEVYKVDIRVESGSSSSYRILKRDVIEDVSLISSEATALLSGRSSALSSSIRQKLLVDSFRCPDASVPGSNLHWLDHPLRFGVGSSRYRYYFGAAIGNCVLFIAVFAAHALMTVVALPWEEDQPNLRLLMIEACALLRFPCRSFPLNLYFFQISLASFVNIVLNYNDESHRASILGLAWCGIILLVAMMIVLPMLIILRSNSLRSSARYVRLPREENSLDWVRWFFGEPRVWCNVRHGVYRRGRVPRFTQRYGALFQEFTPYNCCWFTVEALQSVFVAVVLAYQPASGASCRELLLFVILFLGSCLMLALLVRPFATPSSNACSIVIVGLQFSASVCVYVGTHDGQQNYVKASYWLATAASAFILLWCIFTLGLWVSEICTARIDDDFVAQAAVAADAVPELAFRFKKRQ